MTHDSHGGAPADETCFEAWAGFEHLLAEHLGTMVDTGGADHLILELPGDDHTGTAPYAQFAGFGDGRMVRGEVSSNTFLGRSFLIDERAMVLLGDAGFELTHDAAGGPLNWACDLPIGEAAALASRVVFALREIFGIPHPHLLTFQAWGPSADGVRALGLCASADVAADLVPAAPVPPPDDPDGRPPLRTAYRPKSHAKLVRLVGRTLQRRLDAEPIVDDDGDFVVEHLGQPVWVLVRGDQPAVEILARVAHDVRSRRGAAVETAVLNRTTLWVKWEVRERAVWQTLLVPGFPFAPMHLDAMLDVFFAAMSAHRDDLAFRLGGRVA